MTAIAPHITAFLQERLPIERQASVHTCDAYAYTFQLLLEFASKRYRTRPSLLQLEGLDASLVSAFLEHIQEVRHNGPRTRNARLAAIKSFMRFVEFRVSGALEQVRRVCAIPAQRADTRLVRHLTIEETQAILNAPDGTTRMGIRDRAMLYLGLAGGLRVSELVGLQTAEIQFRAQYVDIHVRGKGRRERMLALWKSVSQSLRAWLAVRGDPGVPELFINARGQPMTRSGFEYVLTKWALVARAACPSLALKRVSPHVLRHTCAMNILHATGDIRKVALWLGHARSDTSEIYVRADPAEKLEVLREMMPPSLQRGRFRPPDKLIASLRQP